MPYRLAAIRSVRQYACEVLENGHTQQRTTIQFGAKSGGPRVTTFASNASNRKL